MTIRHPRRRLTHRGAHHPRGSTRRRRLHRSLRTLRRWLPRGRVAPAQQELADLRGHDDQQAHRRCRSATGAGSVTCRGSGGSDESVPKRIAGRDPPRRAGTSGPRAVEGEDRAQVVARREGEEEVGDREGRQAHRAGRSSLGVVAPGDHAERDRRHHEARDHEPDQLRAGRICWAGLRGLRSISPSVGGRSRGRLPATPAS